MIQRWSQAKSFFPCRACGAGNTREITRCREIAIQRCGDCGSSSARATGTASPAAVDHFQGIDAEKYARSVQATRERSYSSLLERVTKHSDHGSWLDVGCSYGWLLKYVTSKSFTAEGVEPSLPAAEHARAAGLTVHEGLFPEAVPPQKSYSVVSFMDVLEHLDSPFTALQATRALLKPGGVVVIQVPDQTCWLYRIAEWLHRSGGGSFALRRLWLLDFDFPHLTYFTARGLQATLEQAGFRVLELWRSPIGSPAEAFDRVSYATQSGLSAMWNRLVASGVAGIQCMDNLSGHGGLLTVVAQPSPEDQAE